MKYDDLDVLCLPWICDDNLDEVFEEQASI